MLVRLTGWTLNCSSRSITKTREPSMPGSKVRLAISPIKVIAFSRDTFASTMHHVTHTHIALNGDARGR